ncbi:MAG: tetratricopeptide repeat protein [Cyanobacteria bacterium J06576_12]
MLGNAQGAITACGKAIALNPGFVWSHYSLAEVLTQQKQWTAAAQSYDHTKPGLSAIAFP